MPLTAGSLTTRIWRVLDPLPPNFKEIFERNLQRHAFKPIDPERGELSALGWVNIRQMLDSRLNLEKCWCATRSCCPCAWTGLAINQKLFRALLAEEIAKQLRERGREGLSREERLVIEDKVRLDLIKRTQPATATYDVAWHLEKRAGFFSAPAASGSTCPSPICFPRPSRFRSNRNSPSCAPSAGPSARSWARNCSNCSRLPSAPTRRWIRWKSWGKKNKFKI